jgi:hypothetical protein
MVHFSKRISRKAVFFIHFFICFFVLGCTNSDGAKKKQPLPAYKQAPVAKLDGKSDSAAAPKPVARLDTELYNKLKLHLVRDSANSKWPVKDVYPLPGAILPFKRIVAYYGNFYSTHMGILGELPPDEMLKKLMGEVKKWAAADPKMPVIPAIHYIAVSAQSTPGKGNKYRMRMPFSQIDKAMDLAKKVNGIVFLDVQVGWSTLQDELPELAPYLRLPNVHLAIDPEFSMKDRSHRPGTIIGTYDAADINYASDYLAKLVKQYDLPPKILIVHRFTKDMVTNYKQIKLRPEVQVVMDMDGWGFPAKKVSSYKLAEVNDPVQFTGFKLFYKNDIKTPPWKTIMKPEEVLRLYPKPVYIQYQ